MSNPRMTFTELLTALREAGFHYGQQKLTADIERGFFPFAEVEHRSRTGRRQYYISRKGFADWLTGQS